MYPYNLNQTPREDIFTAERTESDREGEPSEMRQRFPVGPPGMRPPQIRPPLERPPVMRPPQVMPPVDRPPEMWPPQPMPPIERPPHERPSSGWERPPSRRPPQFVPRRELGTGFGARAVDAGSIRRCVGGMVFMWLKNGRSMWMYPTFVGLRSISGFGWTQFGWTFTGFSLDLIDGFYCFG